jgi:preprotein translocase subunit SecE
MTNETNEPGSDDLEAQGPAAEGEEGGADTPAQLGLQRFVFAAYFVVAMLVAFIADKAISVGWYRLSQWKPAFGEPREDVAIALALVASVATTLWAWKHENVRRLIEEVATELGQVTWPSKDDVGRSTAVVVGTTILATVFFALMDALWRFLTNLVYGA